MGSYMATYWLVSSIKCNFLSFQILVALLRGLGFLVRLVYSLQVRSAVVLVRGSHFFVLSHPLL